MACAAGSSCSSNKAAAASKSSPASISESGTPRQSASSISVPGSGGRIIASSDSGSMCAARG
eukprot:202531-Rhodomonas_salina.1